MPASPAGSAAVSLDESDGQVVTGHLRPRNGGVSASPGKGGLHSQAEEAAVGAERDRVAGFGRPEDGLRQASDALALAIYLDGDTYDPAGPATAARLHAGGQLTVDPRSVAVLRTPCTPAAAPGNQPGRPRPGWSARADEAHRARARNAHLPGRAAQPSVEALAQAVAERAVELVVSALDVNALLDRVDLNAVLDRVDINRVLDRADLDRLLGRVDITAIVQRVDVNTARLRRRPYTGPPGPPDGLRATAGS